MNIFLILSLCIATVLASDDWDGGHHTQSIKAPAFVLPIPEIGLTFDKIPIFLPLPKIVLSKKPALISKPVFLPLSHGSGFSFGGFGGFGDFGGFGGHGGGHGGGHSIKISSHGGGGHGW